MRKKVIICLYAPANKGKTSTIRKVYELLGGKKEVLESSYEISDVVMRGDIKIGCESLGDPDSDQKEWLEELLKKQCDIIVTASRTRGITVNNVVKLSQKYGYSIEWFSPLYHSGDKNEKRQKLYDLFIEKNAQAVICFIDKIIGGEL